MVTFENEKTCAKAGVRKGAEAVAAPMKTAVASRRALDVAPNDLDLAALWVIRILHPRRIYLFPDS
jgi:hypothetical protein